MRFSTHGLLAGLVCAALLLSGVRALLPGASAWSVALGGLASATLLFAAMTFLCRRSIVQTLLLTALLYGWGLGCLLTAEAIHVGDGTRVALAAAGTLFAAWVWLGGEKEYDGRIK